MRLSLLKKSARTFDALNALTLRFIFRLKVRSIFLIAAGKVVFSHNNHLLQNPAVLGSFQFSRFLCLVIYEAFRFGSLLIVKSDIPFAPKWIVRLLIFTIHFLLLRVDGLSITSIYNMFIN